jgi:hypothetical protein
VNGDSGIDEPAPPRGYAGLRDRLVPLVGGLALVAALIGAVFVVRQPELAPRPAMTSAPVQTPGADMLDWTGVEQVRLGMSLDDLRASFGRPGMRVMHVDGAHDCRQYTGNASDSDSPWAWVRDGEVVTVGVQFADGLPTVFGPAMGSRLEQGQESLAGWSWDAAAPVPVARSTRGAVIATLADIRGDGTLSYATVGTSTGDECQPGPIVEVQHAGAAIEGSSMGGISLGMTVAQVTAAPGWVRTGGSPEASADVSECVTFVDNQGAGAELVRGQGVVALISSAGIAGGPIIGQNVQQAVELLQSAQVTRRAGGVTVVEGVLPDGRDVRLAAYPRETLVEGIDVPVAAETPPGDQIVTLVVLGRPCTDWG